MLFNPILLFLLLQIVMKTLQFLLALIGFSSLSNAQRPGTNKQVFCYLVIPPDGCSAGGAGGSFPEV